MENELGKLREECSALKEECSALKEECSALKNENEKLKETLVDHSISTDVTPIDFARNLINILPTGGDEMAEEIGEYLLVYARHHKTGRMI